MLEIFMFTHKLIKLRLLYFIYPFSVPSRNSSGLSMSARCVQQEEGSVHTTLTGWFRNTICIKGHLLFSFCLFDCRLSSHSRIFHSYGDVTITGEGLQILTYAPRTHDTHSYCQAFGSREVTTCFYDFGLSRLGLEHPTFRLQGECSNSLRYRCSMMSLKHY